MRCKMHFVTVTFEPARKVEYFFTVFGSNGIALYFSRTPRVNSEVGQNQEADSSMKINAPVRTLQAVASV